MSGFAIDWISLALRWAHVIVGIAWIGTSFHFIWLDGSACGAREGMNAGIAGATWMVHGGGFYHAEKYAGRAGADAGRPALVQIRGLFHLDHRLPAARRSIYYLGAATFLIDPRVMPLTAVAAIVHLASVSLAGRLVHL